MPFSTLMGLAKKRTEKQFGSCLSRGVLMNPAVPHLARKANKSVHKYIILTPRAMLSHMVLLNYFTSYQSRDQFPVHVKVKSKNVAYMQQISSQPKICKDTVAPTKQRRNRKCVYWLQSDKPDLTLYTEFSREAVCTCSHRVVKCSLKRIQQAQFLHLMPRYCRRGLSAGLLCRKQNQHLLSFHSIVSQTAVLSIKYKVQAIKQKFRDIIIYNKIGDYTGLALDMNLLVTTRLMFHVVQKKKTWSHLSHMSKIKRQQEPNTMGPTCFQQTENRFLSVWS